MRLSACVAASVTTIALSALLCLASLSASRAADNASDTENRLTGLAASSDCRTLRAKYAALPGSTLTVGLGGYAQGFEMPDAADPAHIVGLDPDMYEAIDACLGTRHRFLVTSFSILVASIGSGRVDIGSLLYVTPERAQRVSFVSVMRVVDGSIVRHGGPALHALSDLCGHTVAAPAGAYEAVTVIPAQSKRCIAAGQPAIGMMLVQNADAALQVLKAGRVDIVFAARPQAVAAAASDPALAFGFPLGLPIVAGYPMSRAKPVVSAAVLDAVRIVQARGIERSALVRWGLDAAAEQPAMLVEQAPS